MKRRDFLGNSLKSFAIAGTITTLPGLTLFASEQSAAQPWDLVAVKGGEPDIMLDQAMKALGGMKKYVKPNQTVIVKPNIGWDADPERAANTNPLLVKRIIEHCFDAGAKKVYVFDHTCDEWKFCYKNSMIENAVKEAGGTIAPGNSEKYYQEVKIPNGVSLKSSSIHELILEADVFINVPILKNHGSARLTVAMKNLMGIVWNRGYWHRNDLHQCIADFAAYKKPQLNIIDAYRIMKRNGPRGVSKADTIVLKSLIVSTDMLAADTAAAKIFGMEPMDIPYLTKSRDMKSGRMDLENLNIKRISI